MNGLTAYEMTPKDVRVLRGKLARGPEILSFRHEPELAALVASLGICREVGTINDEMARFVFDGETGELVNRKKIKAQLVRYHGTVGVKLWAEGYPSLELRFRGLQALLHPRFSFDSHGRLFQCVFFPQSIARILEHDEAELVLVRPWGMNTIFGGFDPSKHYYQTNMWELENNDTLRFADLLAHRKIPFLGTHDLVAHIAGVKASAWPTLTLAAAQVHEALENYFRSIKVPTIASLVLPYTVGVLLDDLAQPPNYDSVGRHIVIQACLDAIADEAIDPGEPRLLTRFPQSYERAITLARESDGEAVKRQARGTVRDLTNELLAHSVAFSRRAG